MWCIKSFYCASLQWYCSISSLFHLYIFRLASSWQCEHKVYYFFYFFHSFLSWHMFKLGWTWRNIRQKDGGLWLRILPLGWANHISAVPRDEVCLCQTCGGRAACFPESTIRFMDWNGSLSLGNFVVKWYIDGTVLNLVMHVVTHILSPENRHLL